MLTLSILALGSGSLTGPRPAGAEAWSSIEASPSPSVPSRSAPSRSIVGNDDVEILTVELVDGWADPSSGDSAVGAELDVTGRGPNLLLAAAPDQIFVVRARSGGRWGRWIELDGQVAEGPDGSAPSHSAEQPSLEGPTPSVVAFGPVRFRAGTDRLEIVRRRGSDRSVTLTFLADQLDSAGDDPVVLGRSIVAGPDRPAIVERSSWTSEGWASGNPGCGSGPSYAGNVKALVVHHTVTGNGYRDDQVDDMLRSVWYGHVRINGWCDIGYNFVVDRFGRIWEGRTGGIDRPVIGGHAKGFNTSTVGVALLGQHQPRAQPTVALPTAASQYALEQLAAWKLGIHGVDPAGTTWLQNQSTRGAQRWASNRWHLVPTVMGHRDLGFTSCPGDHGLVLARGLVPTLTAGRATVPPYLHTGWRPADEGPGFVTIDGHGGLRPSGSAALPGIGDVAAPGYAAAPAPVGVAAERSGATSRGYVVSADGSLTAFGGAAPVADRPAGAARPVDVFLAAGGVGGWVVSAEGVVHGFGGAGDPTVQPGGADPIVASALDGAGNGYLLEGDGGLRAVGTAPQLTSPAVGSAVDIALRPAGDSGWVLAADGRLHSFGGAAPAAVTAAARPASGRRFEALVASGSGSGGWIMTNDGQLWPFGRERLVSPLSTDLTAADAVDVALLPAILPDSFRAGSDDEYFNALGAVFLGRAANDDEMAHWHWELVHGGGRAPVTLGLARSDQWSGSVIDSMYADVLGRAADPAGRRYWLEQMRSGLSVQRLMVYFYGSEEYFASSGSTAGYVDRLYRVLLRRSGDAEGTAYWENRLTSGRARADDVASGFVASPESRRMRVSGLYQRILGRGPDPAGLSYWVGRLQSTDDVALAAELAASDEFHARAVG